MKPVLFSIGHFHIYSFGLMVALGVFISLFLMLRRADRDQFPSKEEAQDMVFWSVLTGFSGARVFYVFENWEWYLRHPLTVFAVWEGGLIFYGGVVGSLLGLYLYSRFKGISYLKSLDFILPYVVLTHAFGRIGCFLNGCCYGHICTLPWCLEFPGFPDPMHPTQLYEAVYNFGLFFFLNYYYKCRRFTGQITFLYFGLYSIARFFIEFLRAGNSMFGPLSWNQWESILILSLSIFFYFKVRNQFLESSNSG